MRFTVRSRKKRSTILSHEELVGAAAEGAAEVEASDALLAKVAELLDGAVVAARELRLVAAEAIECSEAVVVC